jgi:uncharacterized protein (TIGR04255 family)
MRQHKRLRRPPRGIFRGVGESEPKRANAREEGHFAVPDTDDFRFEKPPLIEVIVELHWALAPVAVAPPGGGLDPHFAVYEREMTKMLAEAGYAVREELISSTVPLEFVGHGAIRRYRRGAAAWPVVQVGPGVMTVNIVPPYEGWASFRAIAASAIDMLFRSYPLPNEYLKLQLLQLRYIDAFGADHGFDGNPIRFIRDRSNIHLALPDTVLESAVDKDKVTFAGEWRVPVRAPAGSIGSIRMAPGTVTDRDCMVVEFSVSETPNPPRFFRQDELVLWFDQAHSICRQWFISFPSKELEQSMGSRIPIRVEA